MMSVDKSLAAVVEEAYRKQLMTIIENQEMWETRLMQTPTDSKDAVLPVPLSETLHWSINSPLDANEPLKYILSTVMPHVSGAAKRLVVEVTNLLRGAQTAYSTQDTTDQIRIHLTMNPVMFTASATLVTTAGMPRMILTISPEA